jgi:hypothetical protein
LTGNGDAVAPPLSTPQTVRETCLGASNAIFAGGGHGPGGAHGTGVLGCDGSPPTREFVLGGGHGAGMLGCDGSPPTSSGSGAIGLGSGCGTPGCGLLGLKGVAMLMATG